MGWTFNGANQSSQLSSNQINFSLTLTGSNLIVAAVVDSSANAIGLSSFFDTSSNTYNLINPTNYINSSGTFRILLYWAINAATGSQTLSYKTTGASQAFIGVGAMVFNTSVGPTALDASLAANSAASTVTSQNLGGNLTPIQGNELFITACGLGSAFSAAAVTLGAIELNLAFVGGTNLGLLASYYLPTDAAGHDPQFSWTTAAKTAMSGATFTLPQLCLPGSLALAGVGCGIAARKLEENPIISRRGLILPRRFSKEPIQ